MKNYESQVSVVYYEVDGFRWFRDHQDDFEFDEEQTAFIQKLLPMLQSGDYYAIERLAGDYCAVPF